MGEYAEYALQDEMESWQDEPTGKRKLGAKEGYNNRGIYDGKNRGHIGVITWLKNQPLAGTGPNTADSTWWEKILVRYGTEVLGINGKAKNIGKEISANHWVPFMKWVKETYK